MSSLVAIAHEFSPRYEQHRDDLVSIDVSGLGRLLGDARAIGEELRREAASRGIRVHVAIAGTRTAAMILAHARPGLTLVEPGEEAEALAKVPIGILDKITEVITNAVGAELAPPVTTAAGPSKLGPYGPMVFKHWGVKTLGELAALPSADLAARLGPQGLVWQAIARGTDARPLVPTLPGERFESSIELEWPIDGLEPLSFVLTRLLEPLSTRLERRDRGAAVLHVRLRLVTRASASEPDRPYDVHVRSLQLPTPIRDVRTLRTLALLDLESHPPAAAIDRVTVVIDPTPGRVLQHTLFTRAQPTPEQVSTLIARLGALLGQDRLGAPAVVDSYRPGAFELRAFQAGEGRDHGVHQPPVPSHQPPLISALRRCRHPVPARVAVEHGAPVRVTTDRRGFAGGSVVQCAGPWRTSGEWWAGGAGKAGGARGAGRPGGVGQAGETGDMDRRRSVLDTREHSARGLNERGWGPASEKDDASASGVGVGPHASKKWNRDEWDVALSDGAVYRIFRDRDTERWFIDAIVD